MSGSVSGGWYDGTAVSSSCTVFDSAAGKWFKILAPEEHILVIKSRRLTIYIVHGFRPKTENLDLCEKYHAKEYLKQSRMVQISAS